MISLVAQAQETPAYHAGLYRGTVYEGDTIASITLNTHKHIERRTWKSQRARKRYTRLAKKVKKVYPYAKLAGIKLDQYAQQLENVETEKERKAFYKMVEAELREEYEGELKKLTISEGRILVKLIDRETGNSSYRLVQDLRGKFSAFFWQGLARVFGQNLKSSYDPDGEDKHIEFIILQIEAGVL